MLGAVWVQLRCAGEGSVLGAATQGPGGGRVVTRP